MREDVLCKQKLSDCCANKGGYCIALTDTEFNRPCPFYKKKGENNEHNRINRKADR